MSFFQNIKYELQKRNILTILLAVNVSLFLVINISLHILKINLVSYLALPLNLNDFIFKFWTIFTYMFSHESLGHVFYNMLLLYFSAQTFTNFLNEKKLLYVYIMSGLFGGLILLLLSAIMPNVFSGSYLYGASAAVIGIVASLAYYVPNMPVSLFGVIEMKYKYYALLIFILFTIVDFTINTGGKISHFGGAFFGLFYGYMLKNGKDISTFSLFKQKNKSKLKVVHSNSSSKKSATEANNQQTIDALLDKISKNGYDNLTKAEKEELFKLSQKK